MNFVSEDQRSVFARWTITASLEFETAAQLGAHDADNCDSTFGRSQDGTPVLHGATLAGALRSAIGDVLAGYRKTRVPSSYSMLRRISIAGQRFETACASIPAWELPKTTRNMIER